MALIKSTHDIESLRRGGKILSDALGAAVKAVKPGVTMRELDKIAEDSMRKAGAEPSFLDYTAGGDTPFPATVCISRNEEVIHGPGDRDIALREGDIVGLDIGCWYEGLCTDMAITVPVGEVTTDARSLMNVTKMSLQKGIEAAKAGKKLQTISQAIENTIKPHGYGIVTSYLGHGVGHAVHEDPMVPNFVSSQFDNPKLRVGMVLALEPMVTLGSEELTLADDDWSAITVDGSIAAHFEQTIVITETGAEILTPFPEV
ncbi:type I methionyl aminopeptidase [Candidatus Uhrbacteria bacterium CG10_big_fil_rev_8_21_14_0_10_50_16]|uniref:Methionine aminopeptidase n=1 Tax=Candidatus Uhrbacteria bacterium CG10_big_fil_rev_8_21_14_0_10_50_16 TaxID=1975039 RepID=A0A2H0RLZ8_9BACT|nr:MAG: type I methionyl aminopeptidase [Candidatus Uhrbacteria bacterium CG10_big_fil_rev_8_21_14_0_10_50_16]